VERLRSDAPEAAILAAGNLLARSRSGETSGGPAEERTVADLRRILLDRVLDPRQPISLRADALRAIAPGLDKESAARLRAADLPEELARRLPE